MRRLHPWVATRILAALLLLQGLTVVSVVGHPPRDLKIAAVVGVILAMIALASVLHRWAVGELPEPVAQEPRRRRRRLARALRRRPPEAAPRG